MGWWAGEIEDKVHLSPAEAEIGTELGIRDFPNILDTPTAQKVAKNLKKTSA